MPRQAAENDNAWGLLQT